MSRLTRIGLSRAAIAIATLAISSGTAQAASTSTWNITAVATPTNFPLNAAGEQNTGNIANRTNVSEVLVPNLGSTPISGTTSPIRVTANLKLPPEVTVASTEGQLCTIRECRKGAVEGMTCVGATCTGVYDGTIPPRETLAYFVAFNTGSSPGTGTNTATVSGGEVAGQPLATASILQPLTVSATPAPFELEPSSVMAKFVNADGSAETQAGSHPYSLSVYFAFTTKSEVGIFGERQSEGVEDVKSIAVDLPPGVAGNELSLGQCESAVLAEYRCPGSSQVGSMKVEITGGVSGTPPWGIFNLKPDNGHTNELGFDANEIFPVHMPTSVRTGGDYGLTSLTPRVPNGLGAIVTVDARVWGVPAESSHDPQRVLAGWDAEEYAGGKEPNEGGHESPLPPTPFLTMPSQCGKPLHFRIAVDSYAHPGQLNSSGEPDLSDSNWKVVNVTDPPLEGCAKLQTFRPYLTVAPDTTYADTPAGTTVEVSVPQGEGLTSSSALATPTLQNTSVTLPAGMTINPGQANGLGACQFSEDGLTSEAERAEGNEDTGPASCPADSKVGTVEIETPLLPDKLQGNVYVMQSNPPDLQLLVAASGDDVNLKLIGHVHLNEQTGQMTSTFDGTPALPFTHFRLIFSGGAQAALMTPDSCGVYASTSDFTPWSAPFTPDFLSSNGFALTSGPNGSTCSSPLPFTPSMIAGATTDQAGGYTGFSLLLSRADGQQRIGSLQFKTPEGLLGMLSTVPLCQEPQAAAGTCSSASQIGHTVVGAGAGPDPLYVPEQGQAPAPIYLTGPYKGAPFGLSIVVPVIAGPFNLGTVVVRASISVDPITSQLTISTEPLPQILDGIPTDLRQINTVIDRPGFMFNPTSCGPMEFSGIAESAQGALAPISSHYQVGSCQSLTFKPNFKVSTSGKNSRASGASLDARIVYPTKPLGFNQASSQSNIKSVKVDLPKQLPSRLTTLQHACPSETFNANPANCPAASRIGSVKAVTPVLPVPLTGPVYFVSYGGAKWPELVAVMEGYGVRVDIHGETYIGEKSGITSSTFRQVPDVPIYSFQLFLPQGPFSALAANGNLCKVTLKMPTTFTAQNGAVIHQATPIAVTGCPKQKARPKPKAKRSKPRK
jgi:hypothetical protein